MMTDDKIKSVIEKYDMIHPGDTVIAAVSGGADSMCMLFFFNEYSRMMEFNLIVAHVNHGIRGDEADSDENFVRTYCENNNIKFVAAHYDVPAVSAETKESEELCGRRLRYEFFNSIAPGAKIATAHNLNDCMETFLINIARGTGLKGLCGIPGVNGNIIRPLIECTREEIEQYNTEHAVPYITDSTNLSDDYTRNKIRHGVIPVLKEINPSFDTVFLNCLNTLKDSEKYIVDNASVAFDNALTEYGFSVSYINSLPKAVKDRVILMIAHYYGASETEFKHVNIMSFFLSEGGTLTLPGGIEIQSDGQFLYRKEKKCKSAAYSLKYIRDKSEYSFAGKKLVARDVDKTDFYLYNNLTMYNNCIDADALENAVFRSRKDGDRFKFPNALHSKSIKNLFHEKNIATDKRTSLIFLANDEHVLWIESIGVSDFAKVTEKTEKILKIDVIDETSHQ